MKRKVLIVLAFVLNTFLFGSYYSVGKEMLGRIDPIVFTFFTMMTLVPPALCILAFSWRHLTRAAVKSGFLLGSCLCLGLFTLAVALKYNSATGTAFFPSLNGLLAAIFTWIFLRQPLNKSTWFAGVISVIGAVLLMANASMGGARGALIAFIGGLLCTFYVFLADHEQKDPAIYWPLFGVELLTMAAWANLIALLFGDWNVVNVTMPGDLGVVLYVGLGTIFLPTLITVLLQRHISPVTVSFISVLEPIFGSIVAFFYLHEILPLDGYIGGALIVAGVLIHTWGTVERPAQRQLVQRQSTINSQQLQTSWFQAFVTPMLCCIAGACFVFKLGGFPPPVWSDLSQAWPHLLPLLQGGQRLDTILMLAASLCWFMAWVMIAILGGLVFYRVCTKILTTPAPAVDMDVFTLRQMGYAQHPYTVPVQAVYMTRQFTYDELDEENSLEQERRLHRRVRLAHMEPADDEIYEAPTHIPNRPVIVRQKRAYRDSL